MRLLVQPGDGAAPLLKAIAGARQSAELVIFRADQRELERALAKAVTRGVAVRALIAHTNRSAEEGLRRLEMRLLAAGVMVARTADDLVRYHGKLMIIDHRELYLLGFNLTTLDIEHSRSFGIVTRSRDLVREAMRLFEADASRRVYEAGSDRFLVSPVNARKELCRFIRRARNELLIYDLKLSDRAMIRLLEERANAGVEIKLIGHLTRKSKAIDTRAPGPMRLHVRALVRDRHAAFVGSQSLRTMELDARREVGIIFRDAKAVSRLVQTFDADWSNAAQPRPIEAGQKAAPAEKLARKVAKAVAKELPPLEPVLNGAVKEIGKPGEITLDVTKVEEVVKGAIKDAVQDKVCEAMEEGERLNGRTR